MYELVRFNNVLGQATMGMVSGRPDCFDQISTHDSLLDAAEAGLHEYGNLCIRVVGESKQMFRASIGEAYRGLLEAKRILPDANDDTLFAIVNFCLYDSRDDEYWRDIEDKVSRRIHARKGLMV